MTLEDNKELKVIIFNVDHKEGESDVPKMQVDSKGSE